MAVILVAIPIAIILALLGVLYGGAKHTLGVKRGGSKTPLIVGLIIGWISLFAYVSNSYSTSEPAYNENFIFPFVTFMVVTVGYWLVVLIFWGISGTAAGFTESVLEKPKSAIDSLTLNKESVKKEVNLQEPHEETSEEWKKRIGKQIANMRADLRKFRPQAFDD